MREMRSQGYTYREIGEAFGVSKQRADYLINKAKSDQIQERGLFTRKQWRWVAECRKEGYILKDLAKFLGVSVANVQYHTRNLISLPPLEERKAEFCALPDGRSYEHTGNFSIYSPEQWAWIGECYKEGYSPRELAAFLETNKNTVRCHLPPRRERDSLPPLEQRKAEFYRLAGDGR